ncbi:MAG TPA: hypothetical protein VFH43_02865, partial [Candidatus Kapabacteria bacterium]|nr:hypothetical protein [Candidatus Kapabacteria bacterium]
MRKLLMIVQLWMICFLATSANAQTIAHIQPDAAAPGMTIALEILAHQDSIGTFGPDGFAPAGLQVKLADDLDNQRVIVGVPVVSWRGRMIQVPLFILPKAWFGPVMLRVVRGNAVSAPVSFEIVQPRLPIDVVGSVTLGDSSLGRTLTEGNTLVVQSMNIRGDLGNRSQVVLDVRDPDLSTPGNSRYLPLTILSVGPIKLTNVDVDLSARGKDGGPGGGAGGSGNQGTGGIGYTGGGSSTATSDSNVGSATGPTTSNGGNSITGAIGGGSDQSDQGGGGGTSHPFGTSGEAGVPNDDSSPGGYGGGSAGGEDLDVGAFGGGGGAFAHDATPGVGQGNNAGKRTGGRLLLPLAGGSGGGAGNSRDDDIFPAGSGGGGGGALAIIGFDAVELTNTKFLLRGDSGTTGTDNTAGGGGGAGGGVIAAGAASFKADRFTINVDSGKGGNPTTNGFAGGAGSIGMSRIDGIDECLNCQLPATNHTSLSQKRLPLQVNETITVEGYAGASDLYTENVAIYYRNSHSEWVRVDTVAFDLNGRRVWKKTIPALNDALLFVSAYQQVNAPRSADMHDLEPTWISTHVSHQIVNTTSRAQAGAPDTIYFPLTKVEKCSDTNVVIRNQGEAVLNISGLNVDAPFEANDFVKPIGGYDSSTVTLRYCPKAAGCDTIVAALVTDAGVDSIVLIGCAILTDEQVQFSPSNTLEFNPTRVGECDTMTLVVRSIGEDTVTIQFGGLLQPPFNIDTAGKKTRLGKQELETFTVTFCPTDSGLVFDTARMFDPDHDIFVLGVGLRSILVKRDIVFEGPVCLNYG